MKKEIQFRPPYVNTLNLLLSRLSKRNKTFWHDSSYKHTFVGITNEKFWISILWIFKQYGFGKTTNVWIHKFKTGIVVATYPKDAIYALLIILIKLVCISETLTVKLQNWYISFSLERVTLTSYIPFSVLICKRE